MPELTRELLFAYLDDELDQTASADVEKQLRDNKVAQELLDEVRQSRDRGEHSIGGIWRRDRLTCATREQLTSYLHGIAEKEQQEYLDFHLKVIACPLCLANFEDLKEKSSEPELQVKRRQRYFENSARYLNEKE